VDDFAGALDAATTAFDGFRRHDEPFQAFAALTVGMVQVAFGRLDEARTALDHVVVLGRRMDNSWLESAAQSQLASVAVLTGDVDEAAALLAASVAGDPATEQSTLTLTFALVGAARLADARGDGSRAATALGAADGLRQRKGLRAWPSTRRSEAELAARVSGGLDAVAFDAAFTVGSQLTRRAAVALVNP
jgi:ATP/maltotriose-dependent transcriptional regulator MalT